MNNGKNIHNIIVEPILTMMSPMYLLSQVPIVLDLNKNNKSTYILEY